jgi:ferredoxin
VNGSHSVRIHQDAAGQDFWASQTVAKKDPSTDKNGVNVMARRAYVDQDSCIGCHLCVNTAFGVFRMTDNNLAEVYDAEGEPEATIQEAIDVCPVNCIHWDE